MQRTPSLAASQPAPCAGRAIALAAAALTAVTAFAATTAQPPAATEPPCARPLYLTFDTGHMGVAPLIAQVLARQQVRVTFFAANEPTQEGDGSLGDHWAPWWRARAAEGHAFASHTFDHVYWRADLPAAGQGGGPAPGQAAAPSFRMRASAGPQRGIDQAWTAVRYCQEIDRAARRLEQLTGEKALPLFRAPGGKTSPALVAAARQCGFAHVGWSPAGFLGDELPSERFSNPHLLQLALRTVRSGDILVAHLGIWSRRDAWAPAVLEPLLVGLKERGFCFRTLRDHPDYASWITAHRR